MKLSYSNILSVLCGLLFLTLPNINSFSQCSTPTSYGPYQASFTAAGGDQTISIQFSSTACESMTVNNLPEGYSSSYTRSGSFGYLTISAPAAGADFLEQTAMITTLTPPISIEISQPNSAGVSPGSISVNSNGTGSSKDIGYGTSPGIIYSNKDAMVSSGDWHYMWQRNSGTNWVDINPSDLATYNETSVITQVTRYRRCVIKNGIYYASNSVLYDPGAPPPPDCPGGTFESQVAIDYKGCTDKIISITRPQGDCPLRINYVTFGGATAVATTNEIILTVPANTSTTNEKTGEIIFSIGDVGHRIFLTQQKKPIIHAGSIALATPMPVAYLMNFNIASQTLPTGGYDNNYQYRWEHSSDRVNWSTWPSSHEVNLTTMLTSSAWLRRVDIWEGIEAATNDVYITVLEACDYIASPNSLLFSASGETFVVTANGWAAGMNCTYNIEIPDFCTYSIDKNLITVTASKNNLTTERTGILKINGKESVSLRQLSYGKVSVDGQLDIGNQNFILSYQPNDPVQDDAALWQLPIKEWGAQLNYFDGLGRSIQSQSIAASPSQKDLIQSHVYNHLGIEEYTFLPYADNATSTNGQIKEVPDINNYAQSAHYAFYNQSGDAIANSSMPYAQIIMDGSPLNRVEKQGAPGEYWQPSAHAIQFSHEANDREEVLLFYVDGDLLKPDDRSYIEPVSNQTITHGELAHGKYYYHPGTLFKNVTKDENWTVGNLHTTEEFTNLQGPVVLKRTYVESGGSIDPVETYYVYDDYGLLRFVIPPQAVATYRQFGHFGSQPEGQLVEKYKELNGPEAGVLKYHVLPGAKLELNGGTFEPTAGASIQITSGGLGDDFLYSYKYDNHMRMIEKKLPGALPVYMVYDKRDRLTATQDGNMRQKNQWLFTKYDVLNRPVITAIKTWDISQGNLQTNYNNETVLFETITNAPTGTVYGYNNSSYPSLTQAECLTVTYYDNYEWLGSEKSTKFASLTSLFDAFGTPPTLTQEIKVNGQVTGTLTSTQGLRNYMLQSVIFYDERYRPIVTETENHMDGVDVVLNEYDFRGKVLETWHYHQTSAIPGGFYTQNQNTYDHAGRLLETQQRTTGNGAWTSIAQMAYNELGELVTKQHEGNLQVIDYRYNIRGWLETINDPDVAPASNKLYAQRMHYTSLPTGVTGEAQYNGNIASIEWNNPVESGSPQKSAYGFSYDALNRLTSASHATGAAYADLGRYDVSIGKYDLNGNIIKLSRQGQENLGVYSQIDQLSYAYEGNQLQSVSDDATGDASLGFADGNASGADYAYDANGNMIVDRNKGIFNIQYNYLNLPQSLDVNGVLVDYAYDAAGLKLQKETVDQGSLSTTDYIGSFVYENGSLAYILTGEGRLLPAATYEYEYHLKDHLGNTRVTFNDANNNGIVGNDEIGQVTDYYPFGMPHDNLALKVDAAQKYLYNGKELQEELDWYDYGARMYDASLGRWMIIDDDAEKGYHFSPYNYCFNDPMKHIDPDGNWPWEQKSVRQARRFAKATGGTFTKNNRRDRKRTGIAATVNIHGTSTYINVRSDYGKSAHNNGFITDKGLSSGEVDALALVDFNDGGDYSHYFKKPIMFLANPGAAALLVEQALILVLPPSLLAGNSMQVDESAVLNDANARVDEMGKAKDKAKARGNYKPKDASADTDYGADSAEHTTNASPSKRKKHQRGRARHNRDRGGEKGDAKRKRYK